MVRNAVRQAYWWDARIHEKLRRTAEKELLTDASACAQDGVSCHGTWSQETTLADLTDPDAQFCDGFRTGDTSAWTVTSP